MKDYPDFCYNCGYIGHLLQVLEIGKIKYGSPQLVDNLLLGWGSQSHPCSPHKWNGQREGTPDSSSSGEGHVTRENNLVEFDGRNPKAITTFAQEGRIGRGFIRLIADGLDFLHVTNDMVALATYSKHLSRKLVLETTNLSPSRNHDIREKLQETTLLHTMDRISRLILVAK